ncbi:MAG: hypothetical protein J2P45_22205, partial [Candidatus Dormibacteraeota bacterium]|nr:hypothetical protein [Candidatus Dormibacteraeota bacterium]
LLARIVALIFGLIGSAIALVINITYSTFHRAANTFGNANTYNDPNLTQTHGWIGLGLVAVGVIGSITALYQPLAAVILLLIAGIGLFFVIKGFAIFSILFFVLAAVFAYLGHHHRPRHEEHHEEAPRPTAGTS